MDRDVQPNCIAQRGVNLKRLPPGAISKKEICLIVRTTAMAVATEVVITSAFEALGLE